MGRWRFPGAGERACGAIAAGLIGGAVAVTAVPAAATVLQPNGVVMPVDSGNGETQLYTLFQQRGEAIDFQNDGYSTPDVFSPLCDFSATYLLHEAGSSLGVGWYNVDPQATTAPAGADIHVIVPAGTAVGAVISAADIRNDPAYAGGLIGFALVGGQTHYTQRWWNPLCSGCNPPGPWIMAVTYQSKVTPNAYYVAFEDGSVGSGPGQFNNDGDYNDYVFLFQGITCAGGGEACDTGQPGICAPGVTECAGTGVVSCVAQVPPAAEACNGLDDDCNGQADDGDLCPTDFVCDHGVCVGRCGTGEFQCGQGLSCSSSGYCVDPDCATVTCDAGRICVEGACVAPCDGVSCPAPSVCRVGACVDPCAGVTCPTGKVCSLGACITDCRCSPCGNGTACDPADGRCREAACVGVPCGAGTVCSGGACVDPCVGAVCPAGERCAAGACVPDPNAGAGGGAGSGGSLGSGGSGATGGSFSLGGSGGSAGTGAVGSGSGGTDFGASADPEADSGCGCRAAPPTRWGAAALGLAALGLVARLRARRR